MLSLWLWLLVMHDFLHNCWNLFLSPFLPLQCFCACSAVSTHLHLGHGHVPSEISFLLHTPVPKTSFNSAAATTTPAPAQLPPLLYRDSSRVDQEKQNSNCNVLGDLTRQEILWPLKKHMFSRLLDPQPPMKVSWVNRRLNKRNVSDKSHYPDAARSQLVMFPFPQLCRLIILIVLDFMQKYNTESKIWWTFTSEPWWYQMPDFCECPQSEGCVCVCVKGLSPKN